MTPIHANSNHHKSTETTFYFFQQKKRTVDSTEPNPEPNAEKSQFITLTTYKAKALINQ